MTAQSESSTAAKAAAVAGRAWLDTLLNNLVWVILVIVLAAFSLTVDGFFQVPIFFNILEHTTFVGIIAVGLSFCVIAGHMDLSVESTMGFAAMLAAYLAASGGQNSGLDVNTWVTLGVVILLGVAVGLINGFFVLKLGINAFIVTLAMYIGLRGLSLVMTGGRSIYGLPPEFRAVASTDIGPVPILGIILVAVYLLFDFVLRHTRFGRYVYLIGGNPVAPFRAGIPVKRILYAVFILSGVLAALAGWLLVARTGSGTPNLGIGMLFEAFAAVVIGGVSLTGGVGRLSGVFAGALLLSAIGTAITVMGFEPSYMQIIRAALILVAVLLDSVKTMIRKRYL